MIICRKCKYNTYFNECTFSGIYVIDTITGRHHFERCRTKNAAGDCSDFKMASVLTRFLRLLF